MEANWGYIRYSIPGLPHSQIAGNGPNFPALCHFDVDECQAFLSIPLQGLVPFDGDGHWHLCVDYRANVFIPAITYIDIECNSEFQVAASIAGYLPVLILDIKNVWVLDQVPVISTVVESLGVVLGVHSIEPDLWAYGYPVYTFALGAKDDPQWLWLSPNRVASGFVRADDRRYHELKNSMPGFSLRCPALEDTSYLLEYTDGVQSLVLGACKDCALVVRAMDLVLVP